MNPPAPESRPQNNANGPSDPEASSPSARTARRRLSDDGLAILCGAILLAVSLGGVVAASGMQSGDGVTPSFNAKNPLKSFVGKPVEWSETPVHAFVQARAIKGATDAKASQEKTPLPAKPEFVFAPWVGIGGAFLILAVLLATAIGFRDGVSEIGGFLAGFVGVFFLALVSYVLAANSVVKDTNLEYALWALMIGLIISNTLGTPGWLRPAIRTEFYIKTGLVLMGAGILISRLWALGLPGVFVAWVVTPVVLISTYWFGQRILKIESKSMNMVISADMSVCGVSAAIASSAACKAKKEELSFAIGLSLSFTVAMMILLPLVIQQIGLDDRVAGAWLGGTIDSTGAVGVAGATLGGAAEEVAMTVKMIQNILIGVSAFGIATYWVARVERGEADERPGVSEIWRRFPRFVLGFIAASIVFSLVHAFADHGPDLTNAVVKGSTKTLRGWFFCLAFVCIGLETRFKDLLPYLKGGKPLVLYLCGQSLNLILTLAMAYLMFGVLFREATP